MQFSRGNDLYVRKPGAIKLGGDKNMFKDPTNNGTIQ
jgi:hypothetical protein